MEWNGMPSRQVIVGGTSVAQLKETLDAFALPAGEVRDGVPSHARRSALHNEERRTKSDWVACVCAAGRRRRRGRRRRGRRRQDEAGWRLMTDAVVAEINEVVRVLFRSVPFRSVPFHSIPFTFHQQRGRPRALVMARHKGSCLFFATTQT